MKHEIKVPTVGESIQEVQIGQWLKGEGQWANKDENLVEIESDKATVDLCRAGRRHRGADPAPPGRRGAGGHVDRLSGRSPAAGGCRSAARGEASRTGEPLAAPVAGQPPRRPLPRRRLSPVPGRPGNSRAARAAPQAEAARYARHPNREPPPAPADNGAQLATGPCRRPPATQVSALHGAPPRAEEIVPMTWLRRRIAERLVEAQNTGALLTTFNEVDMSAVIEIRQQYREAFQERYDAKLGFMSFFVKAAIESLKACPELNAEIRDNNIVYRNFYDISIAVGGGKGLVVPVLRNAELLSFAEIEQTIGDFAARAKSGQLKPDELMGGTFTITNGGVFGSMLSTPIVNPPQSGILGLHAIQDRPVARNGQVVIRPMMCVALTYDHRIVDGREAVGFLVRIKEFIEEPSRLLLQV